MSLRNEASWRVAVSYMAPFLAYFFLGKAEILIIGNTFRSARLKSTIAGSGKGQKPAVAEALKQSGGRTPTHSYSLWRENCGNHYKKPGL